MVVATKELINFALTMAIKKYKIQGWNDEKNCISNQKTGQQLVK